MKTSQTPEQRAASKKARDLIAYHQKKAAGALPHQKNPKPPRVYTHSTRLIGKEFGALKVTARTGTEGAKGKHKAVWLCECKCGRTIELKTEGLSGANGRKHCGCKWEDSSIPRQPRKKAAPRVFTPEEIAAAEAQWTEKEARREQRAKDAAQQRTGEYVAPPKPEPITKEQRIELLRTMLKARAPRRDVRELAALDGITWEDIEPSLRIAS